MKKSTMFKNIAVGLTLGLAFMAVSNCFSDKDGSNTTKIINFFNNARKDPRISFDSERNIIKTPRTHMQ